MKSTNIEQLSIKSQSPGSWLKTKAIIPGVLLALILSGISYFIQSRPGMDMVSISAIAITLGIALSNIVKLPNLFQPGIKFSSKKILKLAIIILGFKLNFNDAIQIGHLGVGITFVTITSTFLFTYWLGSRLGLNRQLIQLIAAGTSICGTSAVVATNAVIHASDEDTAYSVTTVTLFSILAMILYPLMGTVLQLSSTEFGFWCGFSIQQTAHVIAASLHYGAMSTDLATISKLSRVIYLVPVVILLGTFSSYSRKAKGQSLFSQVTIPWFVLLFLIMSLINTYLPVADGIKQALIELDGFLFVIAMVAMGLETKFKAIATTGIKPLYLAGLAWIFISCLSLILVKTFAMNV